MKLYVWNNPYGVRYGGSVAYAVAESEEEARELVRTSRISEFGCAPDKKAYGDLDISGSPDRVCNLPYAEIYEWSE